MKATSTIKLVIPALIACAVSQAHAQFGISVLDSQYTTYVMVQGTDGAGGTAAQAGNFQLWSWGDSRMTVSPSPNGDELFGPVSGQLSAQAGTETFGVSASSFMGGRDHQMDVLAGSHNATGGAESQIQFSPVASGTATMQLNFAASDEWEYSAGFAGLVDLTSGQTLWNYGWNLESSTVPWSGIYGGTGVAALTLETDFSSSDNYVLTIYAQTFADSDSEQASIQLSGLDVVPAPISFVPEPSAFVFVGLGAVILLASLRLRMERAGTLCLCRVK